MKADCRRLDPGWMGYRIKLAD